MNNAEFQQWFNSHQHTRSRMNNIRAQLGMPAGPAGETDDALRGRISAHLATLPPNAPTAYTPPAEGGVPEWLKAVASAALALAILALLLGGFSTIRGGPQGSQGAQGEQGLVGADGVQGSQGPEGKVGPQGPAGSKGEPGPQGASVTVSQVKSAIAEDPKLLEQLRGPEGKQGPQGPAGPKGDKGDLGQVAVPTPTPAPPAAPVPTSAPAVAPTAAPAPTSAPASASGDEPGPLNAEGYPGPTTAEAKRIIGLDVQRLKTEYSAFVMRDPDGTAHENNCVEGWTCTSTDADKKVRVYNGHDGLRLESSAGTWRFEDAYPADDAVHENPPLELLKKEQDFGASEVPSFPVAPGNFEVGGSSGTEQSGQAAEVQEAFTPPEPMKLSPADVAKWCTPDCSGALEQMTKADGSTIPSAVKLRANTGCYNLNIPEDVKYDSWNGKSLDTGNGPATVYSCEASFYGQ